MSSTPARVCGVEAPLPLAVKPTCARDAGHDGDHWTRDAAFCWSGIPPRLAYPANEPTLDHLFELLQIYAGAAGYSAEIGLSITRTPAGARATIYNETRVALFELGGVDGAELGWRLVDAINRGAR